MDMFSGNLVQASNRLVSGHAYGQVQQTNAEAQHQAALHYKPIAQDVASAPRSVRDLISSAHEAFAILQQRIGGLEGLLDPVLSSPPPSTGENSEAALGEPQCIDQLMTLLERIRATTNRVHNISCRVRV